MNLAVGQEESDIIILRPSYPAGTGFGESG